ncbi:MAG: SAF domain-containing protein [Pseudomonadota bacterium]
MPKLSEATHKNERRGGHDSSTPKRDLAAGEMLDGEGGFTVYGKLMPAQDSLRLGGLPLGLAHGVKLTAPVKAGDHVLWSHVDIDESDETVQFRREMERLFSSASASATSGAD